MLIVMNTKNFNVFDNIYRFCTKNLFTKQTSSLKLFSVCLYDIILIWLLFNEYTKPKTCIKHFLAYNSRFP